MTLSRSMLEDAIPSNTPKKLMKPDRAGCALALCESYAETYTAGAAIRFRDRDPNKCPANNEYQDNH